MPGSSNRVDQDSPDTSWKWAIPVGCLGLVTIVAGLVIGMIILLTGSMRSSWAYAEAVKMATRNPIVVQALGEPIEAAWRFSGSIDVSGPSGNAELAIPLEGPRGGGTLYVIAHKRAGEWSFELVEVEIDGREERVDLLSPVDAGSSTEARHRRERTLPAPGQTVQICG